MALTAAALAWTAGRLEQGGVWALLRGARPGWLLAAAALVPLQVGVISLRWWLFAERLGVPLAPRRAVAEYGLSVFLNQVLPGGIAGDAVRVWRHGRGGDLRGAVVAAVLERGAGLAALAAVALAGLAAWPAVHGGPPPLWAAGLALGALAVSAGAALWPWRRPGPLAALAAGARQALLPPRLLATHAALSLLLVASFLAAYALTGLALGVAPGAALVTAMPITLLAMSVPAGVGGWGLREASAAALFPLLGQPPEVGVAWTALYGLSLLAGSLPGALALRGAPGALEAARRHPASWPLALLALNALLLLPRILARPERWAWLPAPGSLAEVGAMALRRETEDLLRLVVEVLILATALAATRGRGWRLAAALWGVLLVLQLNEAVGVALMGQAPLFYDELFLARHALVLASDLWQPGYAWGLAGAGLAALGLARLGGALWATAAGGLGRRGPLVLGLLGAAWIYVAVSAGLHGIWFGWKKGARWLVPDVVDNLVTSRQLYRAVSGALGASPYEPLARLRLARRPDVHVFVVESYGAMLADHPDVSGPYLEGLAGWRGRLEEAGWATASARMVAPVSGGRSWQADASLLLGIPIRYESLYQHVKAEAASLPSLVRFFADSGYLTVLIAPKDRERPGVRIENPLGYEQAVHFVELDYQGPALGWGWIPDEYTLLHTDERVFAPAERPIFSFFHMVSSHAPWELVPPRTDDWRAFAGLAGAQAAPGADLTAAEEVQKHLRRFRRADGTTTYMGEMDPFQRESYAATVAYDLELIFDYVLARADPDDLFIVLGDHQPPVLDTADDFRVPVHLVSRDRALLVGFEAYGFRPGLAPAAVEGDALRHEGVLSMLVRELAAAWGEVPREELPPWRPEGFQIQ